MLAIKLGWTVLASGAFGLSGLLFHSCVEKPPASEMQETPGWFSETTDRAWQTLCLSWSSTISLKRNKIHQSLQNFKKQHPLKEEILVPSETETSFVGQYDQLPEIYADQNYGAVFPMPLSTPNRLSWYQTAVIAWDLLQKLNHLEAEMKEETGSNAFDSWLPQWNASNDLFITLAQDIRYLSKWPALLEKQPPHSLINTELLHPHRVVRQSFLPDHLGEVPAGVLLVPVSTDLVDKKFLKELEGAIMTHWNQSAWARTVKLSFHIHWKFLKKNPKFASHQETLLQHLSHFPKNAAILTTGGMTTYVRGNALILGPGKITPRILAHEFGHLLGFNDCYLRTLSGQGIFGRAVLEWDNPFYPDDLMCDTIYGEPRVEAW